MESNEERTFPNFFRRVQESSQVSSLTSPLLVCLKLTILLSFVLEQHLHRDEALVTGTKPLGLFKATTPVFPRSAVLVVKSTENWYRIGRSVKDGEIPRKFVKGRAVTINSKRREEFLKLDGGEVDDQPLFSEDQTEVYVPDPVVDVCLHFVRSSE